ncbi:MAG: hypothetical protein IJK26_06100 [Clostridia bacterium]|nr:hypothetical protein [Clostridia bacterium]
MKKPKYLKEAAAVVLTVTACVFIFLNSNEISQGVSNGLSLCAASVIPSMFPFLVVSDFIAKSGISKLAGSIILKPLGKVLRISDNGCTVFIMSLLGGYPIGPKMTSELVESGKIELKEAQRLNLFCINPSPGFLITMLGAVFFKSKALGVIFYVSCALASFVIAFASSFFKRSSEQKSTKNERLYFINNPVDSLVKSVSSAAMSMLFICAWVVVFNAVISVFLYYFQNNAAYVLCSLLEITNGINLVKGILSFPLCAALIAFGGVSVHFQILSAVRKSGLKLHMFLISRIIHALISGVFCRLILILFPVKADVFSNYSALTVNSFSVSFAASATLIAMCILFILEVDTNKKVC